ncbi:MAG: hypothetical protein IJ507_03480 [Clostridia bacterium]|nr:hypothetical protein [Clostridia bacterium]
MLQDYLEDFILLECIREDDGLGGSDCRWEESMAFQGGVTHMTARRGEIGGAAADPLTLALVHEWGVTLQLDDMVRRVADGVCYRVLGRSSDMRSPDFSALAFSQVPVERLVTPL